MANIERPSEGTVFLPEALSRVGLLGHDSYLYEDMSGLENLRFSVAMSGLHRTDVEIGSVLSMVDMAAVGKDRARTYSAGMKRRIGLARLLLLQPEILLLDEPHASLDGAGQDLVDAVVHQAKAAGRVLMISSHDHERAIGLCDHVLCLEAGRTSFLGTVSAWETHRRPHLVSETGP